MIDKPTGRQLEARWLEVHEGALLLEAARVFEGKRADLAIPFIHTLIATLLLTGGRWREVAGLLVSDVSFERHTITFRPHEHRRLKTRTSHRTVPLHPQLHGILEAYRRSYQRLGGLLFPSPRTGRMITDIRKQMDKVAMTAGWQPGEIRTKIFRHTYCAARLQTLDQGFPISTYTVARELGTVATRSSSASTVTWARSDTALSTPSSGSSNTGTARAFATGCGACGSPRSGPTRDGSVTASVIALRLFLLQQSPEGRKTLRGYYLKSGPG